MPEEADFPYERQEDDIKCGAASLCMVYRSFGLAVTQGQVWPAISGEDIPGRRGAPTHLLARETLRRGLSALVLQAADPWAALERCRESDVRVILHQSLAPGSTGGHFAVVVGVGADGVVLHDPLQGPGVRKSRAELRRLRGPAGEVGQVLVAITPRGSSPGPCRLCGAAVPEAVNCPGCGTAVPLEPAAVLGCPDEGCGGRTWTRLFCPDCEEVVAGAGAARFEVEECEGVPVNPADLMAKFTAAMKQYHDQVAAAVVGAPAGEAGDQLAALLSHMKEVQGQLNGEIQGLHQKANAALQGVQDQLASAKERTAQAAAAQKQAREAAAAARPRKEQKEIDPELSKRLTERLLREFGTQPAPAPQAADALGKEVWEDWPQR